MNWYRYNFNNSKRSRRKSKKLIKLATAAVVNKVEIMNKGTFSKGHKPWNKGVKGLHLNPDTEFKKNKFVGKKHPSWRGGVQVNKNDCVHLYAGKNKRVRRPVAIWEHHYGKIPKRHIIWHIDGDKHNDDISNLECISRAEGMKRNFANRW